MLVSGTRKSRKLYMETMVAEKRIHHRKKEAVIAQAQKTMQQNDMRRFYNSEKSKLVGG